MDDNLSPMIIPIIMFLIPMVAVVGGFAFVIVKAVLKSRVRELEIRERIALIERGVVPAPEVDPGGFERAMAAHAPVASRSKAPGRHRRAGVTMLGLGFGLMVLLGMTADITIGIGVGGFLVMLGLAFLLNSLFDGPATEPRSTYYPPPPPPPTPTPPAQASQRLD